ncbi:PREDICTED: short transient receptor potential channel 3-like [Priapulus caudatus]|uniref:Short transient receptor potential channel 3-like n=1 Tax=Priapulus caudatus TaxID=37621 RepID=A0ABM1E3Q4_PRICU|nr:PREDICTED: short transient receptor potential channel 3-like [Priapulus caudatus]
MALTAVKAAMAMSRRQRYESMQNHVHSTIFGSLDLSEAEDLLLQAAATGNVGEVRRVLADYPLANINCVDYLGRNALQLAVLGEHLDVIGHLLPKSNLQCIGDTLLFAISKGNVRICEMVLEFSGKNSRVWAQLIGNDTFFQRSVAGHHPFFSPDVTPIILAAQHNNFKIVQLFLTNGASIAWPHDYNCDCRDCTNQRTFDSVKHSRSRLNSFRGLASAAYLSLSTSDPIRQAFELSNQLHQLSTIEKEYRAEYLQLSNQCKDYAVELLALCRSTEEVLGVLDGDGPAMPTPQPTDTSSSRDDVAEQQFGAEDYSDAFWRGNKLKVVKMAIKYEQKKVRGKDDDVF